MNAAVLFRAFVCGSLALAAHAVSATTPANTAAGTNAATPCAAPRQVVVIDDQLNQPAWMAEQARAFRLDSPAAAVRAALAGKPCVVLLDADPVFATVPGAAAPELVARIRILELKGPERTLARRASDAVGRYVSSYLGDPGEGVPVLRQAELGGELLCARTRNLVQSASAKGGVADDGLPEDNRKRLEDAAGQLAGLLLKLIAEAPEPCHSGTGGRSNSEKERP